MLWAGPPVMAFLDASKVLVEASFAVQRVSRAQVACGDTGAPNA
jgi:hypothetical protein